MKESTILPFIASGCERFHDGIKSKPALIPTWILGDRFEVCLEYNWGWSLLIKDKQCNSDEHFWCIRWPITNQSPRTIEEYNKVLEELNK